MSDQRGRDRDVSRVRDGHRSRTASPSSSQGLSRRGSGAIDEASRHRQGHVSGSSRPSSRRSSDDGRDSAMLSEGSRGEPSRSGQGHRDVSNDHRGGGRDGYDASPADRPVERVWDRPESPAGPSSHEGVTRWSSRERARPESPREGTQRVFVDRGLHRLRWSGTTRDPSPVRDTRPSHASGHDRLQPADASRDLRRLSADRSKQRQVDLPDDKPSRASRQQAGHAQQSEASQLPLPPLPVSARASPASSVERPSTPTQDPELDFLGPLFNALKALRTIGLQPPNTKVRPLDNVYLTRGLLPDDDPDSFVARLARNPRPVRSEEAKAQIARDKSRVLYVARERERLAEKGSALERLVTRVTKGPLLLLRRCYESKTAVRVVTRHAHGVRGIATGHLLGFDKYMNMVLQNVEESYTVLLRVQRTKLVILTEGPAAGQEVEKVRWVRQQDKRRRRLKQVLLRGDSVVLVSPAPNHPAQPAAKRNRE